MRYFSLLLFLTIVAATEPAVAASLDGRFGITGKLGAVVPLRDDFISRRTSESRAGFATGGGLIFGFGRNLAVEVDVTHMPKVDLEISGNKAYDATFTDVSLGLQYRMASDKRLVPFFGAGVDFIKGQVEHVSGAKYDLDWTQGGHVNAGVDYFLTRGIALTADVRGIIAFRGDVESPGVGEKYDPTSFVGTVGIRLIVPETAFSEGF